MQGLLDAVLAVGAGLERWQRASAEVNARLLGAATGEEAMRLILDRVRQLSTSDCALIPLVDVVVLRRAGCPASHPT